MYNEQNDLRLARANRPIRTVLGKEGKIWFYIPLEMLNELADAHPNDYLSRIKTWRNALWNQDFYHIEVNDGQVAIHIAATVISGGKPTVLELVGLVEDDYIRLVEVFEKPHVADWKAVKKDSRRFYKKKKEDRE